MDGSGTPRGVPREALRSPTRSAAARRLGGRDLLLRLCLRKAYVEGGVLDFYCVVDSYRAAYRSWLLAAVQLPAARRTPTTWSSRRTTLRMKYNVISQADFSAACRPECLHPIVWARFCQPAAALAWYRATPIAAPAGRRHRRGRRDDGHPHARPPPFGLDGRGTVAGRLRDHLHEYRDSVNISGGSWIDALLAPVGLRYHALHHLLPTVPYHSLGAIHRRMLSELPPSTPYHFAEHRSVVQAVRTLFGGRAFFPRH